MINLLLFASVAKSASYPDKYEDCTDEIQEFPSTNKMKLSPGKVYCLYTTQTFFIFGGSDITLAAKYKRTLFTEESEAEAVSKAAGVIVPPDTNAIAKITVSGEDEYSFAIGARPSPRSFLKFNNIFQ